MPTIDINDFWTQALAGLAASLITLLFQSYWIRDPSKKASPVSSGLSYANSHGNQSILNGNKIDGDVRISQRFEDKSRRTAITYNIHHANGAAAPDDTWAKVASSSALLIGSTLLLILFLPLFRAASLGVTAAIGIMLVAAIDRTTRLKAWTTRGVVTTFFTVVTVVIILIVWSSLGSVSREGTSLDALVAAIPIMTAEQSKSGIYGYFDYVCNSMVPSFFGAGPYVLGFTSTLLIAAIFSFLLTLSSWRLLLDWHAYLGFNRGAVEKSRMTRRARRFEAADMRDILTQLLVLTIFSALAILSSQGVIYDALHYLLSPRLLETNSLG
ncbi:hypothetical protein [Rathayibacter agropyri]|uniref:hypothetical protein n=1 Tax=Rathayibacter agropyri TaxID=1634927 RepID=UPI00156454E5|nr:hypothetical protein [Rathayibacter agropyri]NRD07930.1 hypothetical protein [Rathayibacter agropyri]